MAITTIGANNGNSGSVSDTYIDIQSQTADNSAAISLWTHRTSASDFRNALLKFDISSIPSGDVISDVTVYLYNKTAYGTGNRTIALRKLLVSFVDTQANWNDRITSTAWTTAGCRSTSDRSGTIAASVDKADTTGGSYIAFTGAQLITDFQDQHSGTNNGFYLGRADDTTFDGLHDTWASAEDTDTTRPYAVITHAPAGATITSVPTDVARGETGVIIGISGASASQGSATVTYGGEACTITTYPGASGNLLVTVPSTIALQHADATHTFVYTDNDTTFDTSAAVDFNPLATQDYVNLVSPVFTTGVSLLEGYTGDVPVTGDQLVGDILTALDSRTVTMNADGTWSLSAPVTQNDTISRYVIQADGTVGTAQDYTFVYSAGSGAIGDRRRNHNIAYSHMTHSMFNKYK